ncbi:MAG: S8 family serine peptidase [Anaerolineaceae bacterium]|nr:S8 family serine peptidase [Anaerolineaceae bacterium]
MQVPPKSFHILSIIAALVLILAAGVPAGAVRAETGSHAPQPAPTVAGELIIGLKEGFSAADLALPAETELLPAGAGLEALSTALARVPRGREAEFRARLLEVPGVQFVEPNYRLRALVIPPDPLWGPSGYSAAGQWAPVRIHAPDAWDITTGSSSVIVAVIDSGIDASHPEFAGRLLPGHDFVEKDDTPQDLCGHGTHVTGIIAANANNGQGIAGMDWNARILPARALGADCYGNLDDIAEALVWSVDQGARVINLSLGLFGSTSRLLEYATYYAYQHGAAIFAAAGNDGLLGVYYPAAYPWVTAVGFTNNADQRAPLSSYGPQLDVMAPGLDILSTTPQNDSFYYRAIYGATSTYSILSGSSMSTAFASGAAALLASQPQFDTPAKIYEALAAGALDIGPPGKPDNETGFGLLQVDASLAHSPSPSPPAPPAPVVEYEFLSSTRCQNVSYQWEVIPHDAATFVPLFSSNSSVVRPIGFTFNFGGVNTNQAIISANGYLAFDGVGEGAFNNQATNFLIPVANAGSVYGSDAFAAPLWDALQMPALVGYTRGVFAATLGSAPNRRFVVEWNQMGVQYAPSAASLTFQAILFEGSNQMLFQYGAMSGPGSDGSSATVGLEYNGGHTGLQVAYNELGAVRSGQAIHFYPQAPGAPRTAPGCQTTDTASSSGATITFQPFCLEIPAGLLPASPLTTVRVSSFTAFPPTAQQSLSPLGRFAEITLDPVPRPPLNPSPQVCYYYNAQDLFNAGGSPGSLFLAVFDSQTRLWEVLPTQVDTANGRITAAVPHFSIFGVFTYPQPVSLPVTGAPAAAGWPVLALLALGLAALLITRRS